MKKSFEQIKTEITEKFIDNKYKGIGVTEEILTEICGQDVSLYDSFFGDKVDCEYIICDCFTTADNKMSIKINYGERTNYIGYVSVTE